MGETAVETRREVEALRDEVSQIVDELERRGREALDVRVQATRHPAASGALAVGLGGGLSYLIYSAVSQARQRREEQARLQGRAGRWLAALRQRWEPIVQNTARDRRQARRAAGGEASMHKRILWAAMSAVLVALATLLARRMSALLWERTMRERPPAAPSETHV